MKKIILSVILALSLCTVGGGMAYAQPKPAVVDKTKCTETDKSKCVVANDASQSTGFTLNVKIHNPLGVKAATIQDAIRLFVNTIVKIAIPIIIIFFIWSGLSFIFALGNPAKVAKARNMFFYTVIGTLLILGAWTITNAIVGTVNSIATDTKKGE